MRHLRAQGPLPVPWEPAPVQQSAAWPLAASDLMPLPPLMQARLEVVAALVGPFRLVVVVAVDSAAQVGPWAVEERTRRGREDEDQGIADLESLGLVGDTSPAGDSLESLKLVRH